MEIYLHVPYCRQKCRYCDFASFPHAESTQRAYVDAVLRDIRMTYELLDWEKAEARRRFCRRNY